MDISKKNLNLIVGWFEHIQQLADDRKTLNGDVMSEADTLDEIKALSTRSTNFIKKHYLSERIIKPFDLEAAKNGAKVETRNGMKVEIVRWNLNNSFPILGIITGDNGHQSYVGWRINGTSPTSPSDSDYDLVIVEYEDESDWKPTDEQIEAIRCARSFVVDDFGEHPTLSEILMELEEQLRKIKEGI